MRQAIAGDIPGSSLPFTAAVRAGDFVFVSGQASVDDSGNYLPDDFDGEFHRAMDNLRRILLAAGGTLDDVVQVRAYLSDATDLKGFNVAYARQFEAPYPARTTIVTGLGGLKFEIDVVAHLPVAPAGTGRAGG